MQSATPGETENEHMHAELGSVAETGELQYQAALKKGATLVQAAQKLARMEGVPHANELDTTTVTVSSRYRHENQNSIYYLRPNSNEVYFLDFKLRGFCQETLNWQRGQGRIPHQVVSCQLSNANIYVVGGYRSSQNEMSVLRDCL